MKYKKAAKNFLTECMYSQNKTLKKWEWACISGNIEAAKSLQSQYRYDDGFITGMKWVLACWEAQNKLDRLKKRRNCR